MWINLLRLGYKFIFLIKFLKFCTRIFFDVFLNNVIAFKLFLKLSILYIANNNNLELINKLLVILKKPYNNQDNIIDYQSPSSDNNYQTFCGT